MVHYSCADVIVKVVKRVQFALLACLFAMSIPSPSLSIKIFRQLSYYDFVRYSMEVSRMETPK